MCVYCECKVVNVLSEVMNTKYIASVVMYKPLFRCRFAKPLFLLSRPRSSLKESHCVPALTASAAALRAGASASILLLRKYYSIYRMEILSCPINSPPVPSGGQRPKVTVSARRASVPFSSAFSHCTLRTVRRNECCSTCADTGYSDVAYKLTVQLGRELGANQLVRGVVQRPLRDRSLL